MLLKKTYYTIIFHMLDQFYTNDNIALKCYKELITIINVSYYDYILEPSAGNGAFLKLLNEEKRIGIDIEPQIDEIVKMDFFDFKPINDKKYMVIGNPPFGKNSSLAIRFFNRCAEFCDCIAFILPRTFKRVSIQNKLNLNFYLIYNKDLPLSPCCFTPKMNAKCSFQIWRKNDKVIRKVIEYHKTHEDFSFLKHGPKDEDKQPTPPIHADFALKAYGSNCGEIVDTNLNDLRPKSWHWIKSNIDINTLKERFKQLDYSISKDTVRQDSLGQQELIYLYALNF